MGHSSSALYSDDALKGNGYTSKRSDTQANIFSLRNLRIAIGYISQTFSYMFIVNLLCSIFLNHVNCISCSLDGSKEVSRSIF